MMAPVRPPDWGALGLDPVPAPGHAPPTLIDRARQPFRTAVAVGRALVAVLGPHRRLPDRLQAREHEETRQARRLEYAQDLHDGIAHHVTGIVAQAKAARYVAASGTADPAELYRTLEAIEYAGCQALDSMRSMLSVLREPALLQAEPPGNLAELLSGMATEFSVVGPAVTVSVDAQMVGLVLPPAVTHVAHRVVQESLTNVRKHAAAATRVVVSARLALGCPDRLEVSVTDDGCPGGDVSRQFPASGFGLQGLAERVEGVGGTITSGWRDGTGWHVRAALPLAPEL